MKRMIYKRMLMGWWVCCLIVPLFMFSCTAGQEVECSKKYVFTMDWFTMNIPVWEKVLEPYKDKPNIRYLEIGVSEGRSLLWMLDNVLTHRTARATAIDIEIRKALLDNLRISGSKRKVKLIKGRSQEKLRCLKSNSFDLIYIDGSHVAADVLVDAVLSWPLLRDSGLVIFDDYMWESGSRPLEMRPQAAIDAFMTVHRNDLEIIHSGRQRILRKRTDRAPYLSLGQYEYYWGEKNLYTPGRKELVPLSDKEKELIGKLFMRRGFGEVRLSPTPEMLLDPDFIKLNEKLKFNF